MGAQLQGSSTSTLHVYVGYAMSYIEPTTVRLANAISSDLLASPRHDALNKKAHMPELSPHIALRNPPEDVAALIHVLLLQFRTYQVHERRVHYCGLGLVLGDLHHLQIVLSVLVYCINIEY